MQFQIESWGRYARSRCDFNFFDLLRGALSFKAHLRRATELSTFSCRQNNTALDHINWTEFFSVLLSLHQSSFSSKLPWKESFKWDRLFPRPHTNGKFFLNTVFPLYTMMNLVVAPIIHSMVTLPVLAKRTIWSYQFCQFASHFIFLKLLLTLSKKSTGTQFRSLAFPLGSHLQDTLRRMVFYICI